MKTKFNRILMITTIIIMLLSACAKSNNDGISDQTTNEIKATDEVETTAPIDTSSETGLTERQQYLYDNMNNIPMTDFTLPDFDGVEHSISDYLGSIIVLNFWAVGCPPCVSELPDFDEVCQQEGVVLVTVAQKNILGNDKNKSEEFIKQFDSIALWDENVDTMSLYPSQYYPHTYIIDRQGIIRFAINSASYEMLDELVTFCDEVLD